MFNILSYYNNMSSGKRAVNDYKLKIKSLIENNDKIRKTATSTYNSKVLQDGYDKAELNENAAINKYIDNQDTSERMKIDNLQVILNDEKQLGDSELEFIDAANKKYVEDFNKNLKRLNYVDQEIMTKDKLIFINDAEANKKGRMVYMLQSMLLFLFIMILPISLMAFNIIGKGMGFASILISAIITVIVVAINVNQDKDINLVRKTKKTAKDFATPVLKDIIPKKWQPKCPARCTPKYNTSDEEGPILKPDYNDSGNMISLDNSENRWVYGDIPEVGATLDGYYKLGVGVEPKRYYGGARYSEQYTCRWTGDPTKMTNMNKKLDNNLEFTTKIPCEFYPGFETVKKV